MKGVELRMIRGGLCVTVVVVVALLYGLSVPRPARARSAPARAKSAYDTLAKCRNKISAGGASYADKRRATLLSCIFRLLKCELPKEVEGKDPARCPPGADVEYCKALLDLGEPRSTMSKARLSFTDKAGRYCGLAAFPDIMKNTSGGLWYSNDATCGTSLDLSSLLACLRDEIDERVDEMVARTEPRACVLLTNAGRIGDYPNIQATCPATTSQIIAATGAGSGTLVNPGTIAVGAGNTITFVGDDTTLPCGGGSTGNLTVQVGTGGTSCIDPAFTVLEQHVISGPYGSGSPAVMGPFASDVNYCIELSDGGCGDRIFGLIDYP
jgi:hypothetical protein